MDYTILTDLYHNINFESFKHLTVVLFATIVISYLISKLLYYALIKINRSTAIFVSNFFKFGLYLAYIFYSLIYLNVPTIQIWALAALLCTSIALAISSKLEDLTSGLIIFTTKLYQIGDFITVNDIKGKVTNFSIFNTTLLSLDGSQIILSHHNLLQQTIINHSATQVSEIRLRIPTHGSNNRVKIIHTLYEIIEKHPSVIQYRPKVISYLYNSYSEDYTIICYVNNVNDIKVEQIKSEILLTAIHELEHQQVLLGETTEVKMLQY